MDGRSMNILLFKMLVESNQKHLCNAFILLNNINYQIKYETYNHNVQLNSEIK